MSHHLTSRRQRLAVTVSGAALLLTLAACSTPTAATPEPASGATSTPTQTAVGAKNIIERDDHSVAFYTTSGTTGTIVLDAGGGSEASYWNELVPMLAEQTGAMIVTYDRTGSGLSDDVDGAFDSAAAAEDLAAGLDNLTLPNGPIVLASHSMAGEIAVALVNAHPKLVSGAVLIDANVPQFFTPEQTARLVAANDQQILDLEVAPRTRQTRQLLAIAEGYGPTHLVYNAMSWPQSIPVNVIVSAETPMPAGSPDAAHWREAQQQFVDAAPNRTLSTADNSSHDVAVDRPDIIETQIFDLLTRLK